MEHRSREDKILRVDDKSNEARYYLSFFLWPFGLMLASFKHWDRPWSKNVFWLFCIFFGFTFIIAEEGGADSDRYAQLFLQYAHSNPSLKELLNSFYSESSNYVDIAQPLITYIVSRLTHNPSILFGIFGLIFGYFYSRNIWLVLNKIKGNFSTIVILYIVTFILINPIWNINMFRMWTASQIFIYGTLLYLLEGKKKSLIWSGVSVLFHFSFLFPCTILFLFILLKNRLNVYLFFFIITSFINELNLQSLQSSLSFLPAAFQFRVGSYTDIEYAEEISLQTQSLNWYVPLSSKALTWAAYIMVLFTYLNYRIILKERRDLMTLLCFSLLLYGFANIFSLVPSGDRFLTVANSFMFAFLMIFISDATKTNGLVFAKVLSVPFLLLFCIVAIRVGMDFYGLITIFGNPIFAVINTDNVQLITGVKNLF